ncbi:MAG: hypothetical protein ACR2JG_13800 [Geodermatophilaceae bacterium]
MADGLEAALAQTQADTEVAGKAAGTLTRELKKARAAAATGQVRELRKALDAAAQLAADLAEQVDQARAGYDIDEPELLDSGAYTKELLAAAATIDLQMFEEDGRLLCYPSLVRVLPAEVAIEIDRRRERRIRPSAVVELLRSAQQAGPRFRPAPFLASLAAGYDLQLARQGKSLGAVVKLVDVYGVLTLLPGQARDYTKQEFARDLYLLDQSGETASSGGRRLRWAASTGTKQAGVLSTVARSGQQQRYWGIAFDD